MYTSALRLISVLESKEFVYVFSFKRFFDKNDSWIVFVEYKRNRGILHIYKDKVTFSSLFGGGSYTDLIPYEVYHVNGSSGLNIKDTERFNLPSIDEILRKNNSIVKENTINLYNKDFCDDRYNKYKNRSSLFKDYKLKRMYKWASEQFDESFLNSYQSKFYSESVIDILSKLEDRHSILIFSLKRFNYEVESYLSFVEHKGERGIIHIYREPMLLRGFFESNPFDLHSYHLNQSFFYWDADPEKYKTTNSDFKISLQSERHGDSPSLTTKEECERSLNKLKQFPYSTPNREELIIMYEWAVKQFNEKYQ